MKTSPSASYCCPGIGGRIHVALDKRTGYDFIYRQNVIKPALVGLAGPWVSGGIEFNWRQHHRPATFMPVETSIERSADGSITIWCSDYDPMERMKGMHGICIHPGKAVMEQSDDAFTVHLQTTTDMPRSTVRLCAAGKTISEWTGDLTAENPLHHTFPAVEVDHFSLSLDTTASLYLATLHQRLPPRSRPPWRKHR